MKFIYSLVILKKLVSKIYYLINNSTGEKTTILYRYIEIYSTKSINRAQFCLAVYTYDAIFTSVILNIGKRPD